MFAGTSGEGVYRTDDAGASWVQTNGGLAGSALTVRALLVDGSLLLAGTDSGLYLTSDGGSSWTSADASGIQVLSLVNTGTHLLAGRANAPLLRSSRALTVAVALPAVFIAAQGYSVLYLFLIADLVCAASVFPVFSFCRTKLAEAGSSPTKNTAINFFGVGFCLRASIISPASFFPSISISEA